MEFPLVGTVGGTSELPPIERRTGEIGWTAPMGPTTFTRQEVPLPIARAKVRGESYAAADPIAFFEQLTARRTAAGDNFEMPEFRGAVEWLSKKLLDIEPLVPFEDQSRWSDLIARGRELRERPSYRGVHEYVLEGMWLFSCIHDPPNRSFFDYQLQNGRRDLAELAELGAFVAITPSTLNPAALNRLRWAPNLYYAQMISTPRDGCSPIAFYQHDLSHAVTQARYQKIRPATHDRARWSSEYYGALAREQEVTKLAIEFALYHHSHENDSTPIQPGIARCFSRDYLAHNAQLAEERMRHAVEEEALPRNRAYEGVTTEVLGDAIDWLHRFFQRMEAVS